MTMDDAWEMIGIGWEAQTSRVGAHGADEWDGGAKRVSGRLRPHAQRRGPVEDLETSRRRVEETIVLVHRTLFESKIERDGHPRALESVRPLQRREVLEIRAPSVSLPSHDVSLEDGVVNERHADSNHVARDGEIRCDMGQRMVSPSSRWLRRHPGNSSGLDASDRSDAAAPLPMSSKMWSIIN